MSRPTYYRELGRLTSYLVLPFVSISGRNVTIDGASEETTNQQISPTAYVGWRAGTSRRTQPIYVYQPPADFPRKSEIVRVIYHSTFAKRGAGQTFDIPSAGVTIAIHRVLRPVGAGADWRHYATGAAWAGDYGPLASVGDLDPEPEDTIHIDPDLYNSWGPFNGTAFDFTSPPDLQFDLTRLFTDSRDEGEPARWIWVLGPKPAGSTNTLFEIPNSGHATYINTPHEWLEVEYWPPNAVHFAASLPGRPVDPSRVVDPTSNVRRDRWQTDPTDQGQASDYDKKWVARKKRRSNARRLGLVGAVSRTTSVDNSRSVSGKFLFAPYCYNEGSAELTPTAYWDVEVTSTTQFKLWRTIEGAARTLMKKQGAGSAGAVNFADDNVFVDPTSSEIQLAIYAVQWTSTTANTSDVFDFFTTADSRTTESISTLPMLRLAPPQSGDQDQADSTREVKCTLARFEQLMAPSTRVDIGSGVYQGVLPLRDTRTGRWEVNQPIVVFNSGETDILETTITHVYAPSDGTFPNSVRVAIDLTAGRFPTSSGVCSGVFFSTLIAPNQTRLAVDANAPDTTLALIEPLSGAPDTVVVTSLDADEPGFVELDVNFLGDGGQTVNLLEAVGRHFAAGAVVAGAVTNNSKPVYLQAEVPANQLEALYDGWLALEEFVPRDAR